MPELESEDWAEWARDHAQELELWKLANQEAREDIVRYKNQQWQVAYFGILLYGALIALADDGSLSVRWMSAVLAALIALVGSLVLCDLHVGSARAREKGKAAVRRLEPDLRRIERAIGRIDRPLSNKDLTRVLVLSLLAGAIATVVAVLTS